MPAFLSPAFVSYQDRCAGVGRRNWLVNWKRVRMGRMGQDIPNVCTAELSARSSLQQSHSQPGWGTVLLLEEIENRVWDLVKFMLLGLLSDQQTFLSVRYTDPTLCIQLKGKIKSNWKILDDCTPPPFSNLKIDYLLLKDHFQTNMTIKIKFYHPIVCFIKVMIDSENLVFWVNACCDAITKWRLVLLLVRVHITVLTRLKSKWPVGRK